MIAPAELAFTRHLEHEADRFALEITQTNHSAGTAFVKLQEDALANPRPGLLFKLWRSSHPPLGERIDFGNDYHPWREGGPCDTTTGSGTVNVARAVKAPCALCETHHMFR